MDPDKAYKERVGISVAKRLEEVIQKGMMDEDTASDVAAFVLDNIDKTQNSLEIVNFLEELSKKWPVFQQVLTLEQGQIAEKKSQDIAQQASDLIKNNQMDEALKMVQSNNDSTGGTQ